MILSADLDGDGNVDLIAAPTDFNRSSLFFVYFGKGDGTFPTQSTFDIGSRPGYLLAADLNGDKLPDIIAADFTEAAVSVLLNTFTVTAVQPDFTLSPVAQNLTMKRGGQASDVLAIEAQGDSQRTFRWHAR